MTKTKDVISPELKKFEQKMLNKLELSVESLQERFDTLEEHSVDLKDSIMEFLNRQDRFESALVKLNEKHNENLDKRTNIPNEYIISSHKDFNIPLQNQSQDLIGWKLRQ